MKRPSISDEEFLPELECPTCGRDGYLHQRRVDLYFRNREDADIGTHLFAKEELYGVNSSAPMQGNPSPRRNGLNIQFGCEICGGSHDLAIFQHKGKTYTGWK